MSDLAELLKRVEAATGADRGLDGLLARDIEGWSPNFDLEGDDLLDWPTMGGHWHLPGSSCDHRHAITEDNGVEEPPAYTASIDAALALVERKLPDHWGVGFFKASYMPEIGYKGEGRYCGEVWHVATPYTKITSKKTTAGPALAILAALLAALLHEGQG